MEKVYLEVLNKDQLSVFPKLDFLQSEGFYLAGGTALALQVGHRTSVDFDFYNSRHFDERKLYDKIQRFFKDAKETLREEDTLFCKVKGVELSFFWYKYPLIKKARIIRGVPVASIEDIAAMKLIAITHRPVKRDYIDIFFLLKSFTLDDMFSFVSRKYADFNRYLSLRALTYFEDIKDNEDKRSIEVFDSDFSWMKAKEKIFEEVKKYQLAMMKKK